MEITDTFAENTQGLKERLSDSALAMFGNAVLGVTSALSFGDYLAKRSVEYNNVIAMFPNAHDYAHKIASEVSTKGLTMGFFTELWQWQDLPLLQLTKGEIK